MVHVIYAIYKECPNALIQVGFSTYFGLTAVLGLWHIIFGPIIN